MPWRSRYVDREKFIRDAVIALFASRENAWHSGTLSDLDYVMKCCVETAEKMWDEYSKILVGRVMKS